MRLLFGILIVNALFGIIELLLEEILEKIITDRA